MKQTMYIGPTVHGLVKKDVIFKDKVPEAVVERAKADKNFARLLVPMEEAILAKRELLEDGSVRRVSYQRVLDSIAN